MSLKMGWFSFLEDIPTDSGVVTNLNKIGGVDAFVSKRRNQSILYPTFRFMLLRSCTIKVTSNDLSSDRPHCSIISMYQYAIHQKLRLPMASCLPGVPTEIRMKLTVQCLK